MLATVDVSCVFICQVPQIVQAGTGTDLVSRSISNERKQSKHYRYLELGQEPFIALTSDVMVSDAHLAPHLQELARTVLYVVKHWR
jgi:hypothetical protein